MKSNIKNDGVRLTKWYFATYSALLLILMLSVFFWLYKTGFETQNSPRKICNKYHTWCFERPEEKLALPNLSGNLQIFEGDTYGMAWGDANGDVWPDLYLNHHTYRNTKGRFPPSHLLFSFGKPGAKLSYAALEGRDQHSAIFFDVNADGNDDILETIGGMRGRANPTQTDNWNRVHLGGQELKDPAKIAKEFGLNSPGGRGRSLAPLVAGNELYFAMMNAARSDALFPSQMVRRRLDDTGRIRRFEACPESEAICGKAGVGRFQSATVGYFGKKLNPLVLLYKDYGQKFQSRILVMASDGGATYKRDFHHRFNHALTANLFGKGLNIITKIGKKITIFDDVYAASDLPPKPTHELVPWQLFKKNIYLRDLAVADMNNDSLKDIVALYDDSNSGVLLVIWQQIKHKQFRANNFAISGLGCKAKYFAIADADLNGSLDLLLSTGNGPAFPECRGNYLFLKNASARNWLEVDLHDQQHLSGLGAQVEVAAKHFVSSRVQDLGIRSQVQDHKRLHFGLNHAQVVDLKVTWRGGETTLCTDIRANNLISIRKGVGCEYEFGSSRL